MIVCPADSRPAELKGIIENAVPSPTVDGFVYAYHPTEAVLIANVAEGDAYHLVLHHCGGANAEYPDFIDAYRKLCSSKKVPCPPILLFSGGGLRDAEKRFGNDPGICVLSDDDLKEKLGSFLSTPNEDGQLQLDLLRPKPSAQILTALSVLCQGHLAVRAAEMGWRPDVAERKASGAGTLVDKALREMGWANIMDPKNPDRARLAPALKGEDARTLGKLVKSVSTAKEWRDVFVGTEGCVTWQDVTDKYEEEWKAMAVGKTQSAIQALQQAKTRAEHLMEAIGCGNRIEAVTVADAYVALAEVLGEAT